MFSYYGSKSKVIDLYPPPKYDKIIEPFAGSARYSLKYWDRDITLLDKYEVIVKIWKWLQLCSESDILSLPVLKPGQNLDDFTFDCIEAKWLMGFMVQGGVNAPRKTVSKTGNFGQSVKRDIERIASSIHKIKHWKIMHGEYDDIINTKATWFIDPPYQYGGEYYIKSSKHIDYNYLAEWSMSRDGQVIVCENSKADWMDFLMLSNMNGSKYKTTEVIWTNMPTSIGAVQTSMF